MQTMTLSQTHISPDANLAIQLNLLMEAAGDAVFHLNDNGDILHASKRTTEIIRPVDTLRGTALSALVSLKDRLALVMSVAQAVETRQPVRVQVGIGAGDAVRCFELQITAYTTVEGRVEMLAVGRDISEQHNNEDRLRHLATHDALTGLPNRALLSDRLNMAIAQAKRTGKRFSVLALDLDGFKKVNDALGHPVGDILLRVAAERLRETLRDVDTLARVGGDEFIAVLPSALTEREIQIVARRMISAMQSPFEIQGHTLHVSTSIGAATYPEHGDTEVQILAHADTAMYRAKETGKARYVIFDHARFTQPEHDVSMEAAMFEAVRNGEFLLHYQPIVDSGTRRIIGFEALMRWTHPDLGLVSPVQFIPMAENNGLINLLGAWAIKAACVQVKLFEEAAGRPLYVAVNVSPRQFRNDQFLTIMDDAMAVSGVDGSRLLLEITEGILMSDPEHAETLLSAIVERDVRIAIDDFGTGYSNIARLRAMPLDRVKLDPSLIADIHTSEKARTVVQAVIQLIKGVGAEVVAEAVENIAQADILRAMGCDTVQGFIFAHPMFEDDYVAWITNAERGLRSIA